MRDQVAFTVSAILLALLLVFVAILAFVLFTFSPPEFNRAKAPLGSGMAGTSATGRVDLALSPDAQKVLREEDFTSSAPDETAVPPPETIPEEGILLGGSAKGELPMLCPQTGPEIRAQVAYPHPALCQAEVSPSRVVFHFSKHEQDSGAETQEEAP